MERTELMKSSLKLPDTQSVSKISEWLAENRQAMQQTLKQIMKLIKEDSNSSTYEMSDFDQTRPQLLTLVEEFNSMYQSLAEHCSQIRGKSQQCMELQMESQEALQPDSNKGSPDETPEIKLQARNLDHHRVGADRSFSSGGVSFETSLKESSRSSSVSSDSGSENLNSAINSYLDSVRQINGLGQQQSKSKPVIEPISMNLSCEEVDADDGAKKSGSGSYEGLIGRIVLYEGELKVLNQKHQQSKVEITMLRSALKGRDGAVHDLQVQLEATKTDMEKQNEYLEEAKGKILHLESQILELEIHLADSHCKTEMLTEELKQAQEKVEKSNEDAAIITSRLDLERQKVAKLQERISMCQKDVFDRENEIVGLQSVLSEAERKHHMDKEQLIMQWDSKCKQLEMSLRQREDDMKELHRALVRDMQDHINNSQVGIEERESRIHSLNKELDRMKLRHDMVVAEKDAVSARVQALLAELSCRYNHIEELTAGTASGQECAGELNSRVQELENKVEMQKALISDGAEKKREAIRQLCFSLEHYRTGYHELREAFLRHTKGHAVLTS